MFVSLVATFLLVAALAALIAERNLHTRRDETTEIYADILLVRYFKRGKLHQHRQAALYEYRTDGSLCRAAWYRKGQCHRTDGPAKTRYTPTGQIDTQEWWIEGKELDGLELLERLASTGTPIR